MPALLTSTSSPPRSSSASSNQASISPSLRTFDVGCGDLREFLAEGAERLLRSTSQMWTFAPSSAKALAMARPIPAAAAVIMTRCGMLSPPPLDSFPISRTLAFHLHFITRPSSVELSVVCAAPDCGQGLEQVAAHGDNFSGLLVDMELHDLVGGDEFAWSCHDSMRWKRCMRFSSQPEHLRFDGEGLAEPSSRLIVVEVRLGGKEGVAGGPIGFVVADVAEEGIEAIAEGDEIMRHPVMWPL